MTRRTERWVAAAVLGAALMLGTCATLRENTRYEDMRASSRTMTIEETIEFVWSMGDRSYRPAELRELDAFERLLAAIGRAPQDALDRPDMRRLASVAGFDVEEWTVGHTHAVALVERERRGAGAYFFRIGRGDARRASRSHFELIQAPHAYFDVGTGAIAVRVFFEDGVGDALFTNTVHRYWSSEGPRVPRQNAPADVCQQTSHFFHQATRAVLSERDTRVTQLHGFGGGSGDEAERSRDIIVSSTDPDRSSDEARRVSAGLREQGFEVAVFPEEASVLGGTTNEQGRLVGGAPGRHAFLHIETSRHLRRRLMSENDLRLRFVGGLWGIEGTDGP